MATIRITDLQLRTFIGFNEWEKDKKQDVVINLSFEYNAVQAAKTDDVQYAVDYKVMKRKVIALVEKQGFHLLEKMATDILAIMMSDDRVLSASVRIDKPGALRFARSVSVELSQKRDEETRS